MELRAGSTVLTVDESFGARVASLLVSAPGGGAGAGGADGRLELAGRYQDSPHGWGAFPMAPWAGRVRGGVMTWRGADHRLPVPEGRPHAIHGTVARAPWQVLESEPSARGTTPATAVLSADLGPDWPWPGHALLRYALQEDSLATVLEVHADAEEMPAWCGTHPWFPRTLWGARVRMDLRARALLHAEEEGIPTAREEPLPAGPPEDEGINHAVAGVQWPVVLTWPGVARLEVSADSPWAVVFTVREEAVCVEPQTAPPDATALGLEGVAAPGAPVVLGTTWRWRVGDDVV